MVLTYCFEKRYYYYKEDTLFVYLVIVLPVLGIFFWAPIAVNCYQIEPGYVLDLFSMFFIEMSSFFNLFYKGF